MDVNTVFMVAQIMGGLYTTASVISTHFKARRNIVLALLCAGILNNATMILLGEYSGMVMNSVGIILNLVAFFYARVNKVMPKWLLAIFLVAEIIACVTTIQDWRSLLVLVAQVAFVFSMGMQKENATRKFLLVNATFWTVFNLLIGSYGATIGSGFFAISALISIIRYSNNARQRLKKHRNYSCNHKA